MLLQFFSILPADTLMSWLILPGLLQVFHELAADILLCEDCFYMPLLQLFCHVKTVLLHALLQVFDKLAEYSLSRRGYYTYFRNDNTYCRDKMEKKGKLSINMGAFEFYVGPKVSKNAFLPAFILPLAVMVLMCFNEWNINIYALIRCKRVKCD